MAKTDERVMDLVEKEIRKDPGVSSSDLFEKAKKVVSSLGELTLRQFHARYPLQIKRRMAMAEGGGKRTSGKRRGRRSGARKAPAAAKGGRASRGRTANSDAPSTGDRDQVRSVLLKFAADLSAAEARKDLVKVLAGVDRYVDDVMKAAR